MAKILVRYLKQGNKSYRIMLLNNITNTVHKKKKKTKKIFPEAQKNWVQAETFFYWQQFSVPFLFFTFTSQ